MEAFYWAAITFSQTLGTALGDWMADTGGLGYLGGALVFGVGLAAIAGLYFLTERLARAPVLGGVHSHPSAGRNSRRLPGQADKRRRSSAKPTACLGRNRGVYRSMPIGATAAGRSASSNVLVDWQILVGRAAAGWPLAVRVQRSTK